MANIDNELNKIKNAVYGKDVRGAIHDGIEKVYNDATKYSGEKDMEVVLARGSHSNLKDRLNKTDQQLAEKAQKEYVNDFKDVTELALIALDAKIENRPPPEPEYIVNLWDLDTIVDGNLSDTSGTLNPSTFNSTTPYTKIIEDTDYTFSYSTYNGVLNYVVCYYLEVDEVITFVSGFRGTLGPDDRIHVHKAPAGANRMRVSAANSTSSTFVINIGDVPMSEDNEGDLFDGGFWDGIPTPPLRENSVKTKNIVDESITLEKVSKELLDLINSGTSFLSPTIPYPGELSFKEISTGFEEVNHLSQDGKVVYFKRGRTILQSFDDGNTKQEVGVTSGEEASLQAIRDLADGELLVSVSRDESIGLKSKIFKSVGYDRDNPANTQFVEVMEAISSQANIYSSWGLETHDNICIASEYGLRGDDGARHVYLSTDYGDTWKMIFDQKTTTQSIAGAPEWTTSAHLHTVHYDRYWERIWLVVGDNPNSATYYTDDFGENWKFVDNPINMQYTGIMSFVDGVIFGSDRNPNGLYVWKRTENKEDEVVIEPLKIINDENIITHVFHRAFRRFSEKGEIALFAGRLASSYGGEQGSVIMASTGINNPYMLYELESGRAGFSDVVGVTAKGNILTSYHNGTNHSVLRAKAPIWE